MKIKSTVTVSLICFDIHNESDKQEISINLSIRNIEELLFGLSTKPHTVIGDLGIAIVRYPGRKAKLIIQNISTNEAYTIDDNNMDVFIADLKDAYKRLIVLESMNSLLDIDVDKLESNEEIEDEF